jgi:glycosyltransferase involved in cell wall biosynthesis
MMKKIAIVTPELAGIYKNGGIGTNYFFRARFLSGHLNDQVTILYTGGCSPSVAQAWRERYGQAGIRLEVLPKLSVGTNWEMFHQRAVAVHQRLAVETWDEIHFSDYLANGFVCLQAKRAGLAYQNTRLMVTMDSSSLWCREGMQQWSLDPETDTKVDYAEQYCCENADTLVSPSRYLMRWAERRGWRLPPNRVVLSHLYEKLDDENAPAVRTNPRHLIYFGRLETRKGLGIFCEAVERLAKAGQAPVQVDFLGKVGTHEGRPADHYIRRKSSRWQETETHIYPDLDNFAAMKHIRRTGGVTVVASPCDNLPYTVVECIVNQVPFIASNSGGIPELADARMLFAPDARSLAAKLEEFSRLPPETKFNHPYQLETVRQAWKKFAETPVETAVPSVVLTPQPKISVCVPFYNHGLYLPEALSSLSRQTYENFEVIVVDDGSTNAGATECFARMQKEYLPPRFRFFRQQNGGVGAARNFAAAQATGDLLVFMDADNVAREQMLAVFAKAMQVSGADCATCNYDIFNGVTNLQKSSIHTCAPLGPCLEAGWRVNIFGDANFVVKKSVFTTLGGFATDRSAVEDWQFLVRLTLRGFRQIVIPESLYWYRHLPNSMMRTTDELRFTRTILETYREGLSSWPARIIENHAFGPFLNGISGNTITINSHAMPVVRKAGQRPKFIRKLQKSCAKRLLEFAGFISRL